MSVVISEGQLHPLRRTLPEKSVATPVILLAVQCALFAMNVSLREFEPCVRNDVRTLGEMQRYSTTRPGSSRPTSRSLALRQKLSTTPIVRLVLLIQHGAHE